MVRATLRRANSFTFGRISAKCTLQYLLVWTVILVTINGFFHLYHVHGFFNNIAAAHNGGLGRGSSSKTIISLSKNVEVLQLKVGKAIEEIQIRLLAAEAVETIDEALHQLRSEWKRKSNLLVDIAATLDHVNLYLQHTMDAQSQRPGGAGFGTTLSQGQDSHLQPQSLMNCSTISSTRISNSTTTMEKEVVVPNGQEAMEKVVEVFPNSVLLEDDEREEGEWEEEFPKETTDPLVNFFLVEEIRKYLRIKHNRLGRKNFMGANATYASIGHACVSHQLELEQYMDYEVGEFCADDWNLGQKLIVHGCDPLPRRRCFARGPKTYQKPVPMNESVWSIPDDRNVRWDKYICKSFKCLAGAERKGFFKCSECFNLERHEKPKWMEVTGLSMEADFLLEEVLSFKPGEIRIGLDFSVGVGTFAARMREHNITIASATLNLGAPFNEFIALRGLLPLYLSVNQRLPFFDNTLDIVHSSLFLDGWIDHQLLDFVLLDWDRVIRPGGLLWIDRFFCKKEDLDDYLYYFEQLRYKKLKWVVSPKSDKEEPEMWFSAVLEKPPRPF
ncbi:unnamed protein product [Calypogeia fissa]